MKDDIFNCWCVQWDESQWILGDVTTETLPPFTLCEESDGGPSFYLFPDKEMFWNDSKYLKLYQLQV